jgi:hypothetical protein
MEPLAKTVRIPPQEKAEEAELKSWFWGLSKRSTHTCNS